MDNFLIYGANGYTGELTCRLAVEQGMRPLIAGRSEAKVKPIADKLGLEYLVFSLEESDKIEAALSRVKVVLHCAGPFSRTAQPMAGACLKTGTHYVDITGEVEVFEYMRRLGDKARGLDIMLLPGGGFDVVPSDCMAAFLKQELPDAAELTLALFSKGGAISHGTATTMLENVGRGGAIRENGQIKTVPHAYHSRTFDFGFGQYQGTTIPWGDISTAYTSTRIPNIRVYNCMPPSAARSLKMMRYTGWLMATGPAQKFLKGRLAKRPAGPTDEKRAKASSYIWGEVSNGSKTVRALHSMPEGYTLTALSSLKIIEKILQGDYEPGYQTPATAYGADLFLEIPGAKREILHKD